MSISDKEKLIIDRIVQGLPENYRNAAIRDLAEARIEIENIDKSSFVFYYDNRDPSLAQRPISDEWRVKDSDGEMVSIIIYVGKDRRLREIEFIREAAGPLLGPLWDTLEKISYE